MIKKALFFASVSALFAVDRVSKSLVLRRLPEGESVPVVPGVFHFTGVRNTGAAFGIFRGEAALLVGVTAVSAALISLYVLLQHDSIGRLQRWGWSLVVGGALGNLCDRVLYGHVIDFLDFRVWPVFNLADIFVCTGVGLIFLGLWKR